MSYRIVQRDIAKSRTDTLVNIANRKPVCTPGTEMDIYAAAGFDDMLNARLAAGEVVSGEAFVTPGFGLNVKHVIHTVLPRWEGGGSGEYDLLRRCYRSVFDNAIQVKANSISMPVLGLDIYGFPPRKAIDIAIDEIEAFLQRSPVNIFLIPGQDANIPIPDELTADIDRWLNSGPQGASKRYHTIESAAEQPAESFSERFFRLVDEKGWKDSDVYNRANVDRRIISRMRSDPESTVSKNTALSLAIALHLTLEETREFIALSGWALSDGYRFDRIIQYFLEKRSYNMAEINETLCHYCGRCLM